MSDLKGRLEQFAQAAGFKRLAAFESACGFNKNTLTKKTKGMNTVKLLEIVEKFPQLNLDWLITGSGQMVKGELHREANHPTLPLIPVEAFAGPGLPAYEDERVEEYYTVSDFKNSDFLIRVKGDSMVPKYNGGDIVACKKVGLDKLYFLQWNRAYVIYTESQGIMIKRVQPSEKEGYIKCVSDNPKYAPFDVPMNDVVSIALVNGAISLE